MPRCSHLLQNAADTPTAISSLHFTQRPTSNALMHTAFLSAYTTGHYALCCTCFDKKICAKIPAYVCRNWDTGDCLSDCVNLHQVLVEQLLQRVWDKGDIYKAKYEGDDTCNDSMNNNINTTCIITRMQNSAVCQAALTQACDQSKSCHAVLHAVTVDTKAVSTLDKAVLACTTHTVLLVGIDHACR